MSGQLQLEAEPESPEPFDWKARLDGNWTDCQWVLNHRDEYPTEALEAAEAFLSRYPSRRARELAHAYVQVIEAHHARRLDHNGNRKAEL